MKMLFNCWINLIKGKNIFLMKLLERISTRNNFYQFSCRLKQEWETERTGAVCVIPFFALSSYYNFCFVW